MSRLSLLLGLLILVSGCAKADQLVRDAIDASRTFDATWDTDASAVRGETGRYVFVCSPNPPAGQRTSTVWGSNPYTDDSSVCRAAVHAGAITYASGGRVTVEMRPGQDQYRGSARNGVETRDYGTWGGSFSVLR